MHANIHVNLFNSFKVSKRIYVGQCQVALNQWPEACHQGHERKLTNLQIRHLRESLNIQRCEKVPKDGYT